jgi:hypothetical protein
MNDISERCRYTFYKKVKYAELNNRNKNKHGDYNWIKNRNEALRLAWKEYKYTRKVEKVCPEFMYTSGFGLASYIKIKSMTESKVLRELGKH